MSKITFLASFIFLALPSMLFAADTAAGNGFVPLVGVPFLDNGQQADSLVDYANAFYIGSISLAAVIAVLRIIFAGVKYMLTDITTTKGQAKKDIQASLVGLIIIIGAVLILDTINPTIKNVNPLSLKPLHISQPNNTGSGNMGNDSFSSSKDYCDYLLSKGETCILKEEDSCIASSVCEDKCKNIGGFYIVEGLVGNCYQAKTTSQLTLDNGRTIIDAKTKYTYYNNDNGGLSTGAIVKIIAAYQDQTVDLVKNDGKEIRGIPCIELSPNIPGCTLPDSRKLTVTSGQSYYRKQSMDEIAANDPKQKVQFIENYQTIDGTVLVSLDGTAPTLISCNSIEPAVCNDTNN